MTAKNWIWQGKYRDTSVKICLLSRKLLFAFSVKTLLTPNCVLIVETLPYSDFEQVIPLKRNKGKFNLTSWIKHSKANVVTKYPVFVLIMMHFSAKSIKSKSTQTQNLLTLPTFNHPWTSLNKGKLTRSSENDNKSQNKEIITLNNSASRIGV